MHLCTLLNDPTVTWLWHYSCHKLMIDDNLRVCYNQWSSVINEQGGQSANRKACLEVLPCQSPHPFLLFQVPVNLTEAGGFGRFPSSADYSLPHPQARPNRCQVGSLASLQPGHRPVHYQNLTGIVSSGGEASPYSVSSELYKHVLPQYFMAGRPSSRGSVLV